jgi:hypothetical protein
MYNCFISRNAFPLILILPLSMTSFECLEFQDKVRWLCPWRITDAMEPAETRERTSDHTRTVHRPSMETRRGRRRQLRRPAEVYAARRRESTACSRAA